MLKCTIFRRVFDIMFSALVNLILDFITPNNMNVLKILWQPAHFLSIDIPEQSFIYILHAVTYESTSIKDSFNYTSCKYRTIQTSLIFGYGNKFIHQRFFLNNVVCPFIVIGMFQLVSFPSK